jgi:protein TonB
MRARSIPFWLSAFLHFAVIAGATVLFVRPPEFAMATGHNSVEVNLVAAAPDPTPPPPPITQPQEPAETQPPKPDDVLVPVARPVPPVPVPPPEQPKVETPPRPAPVPPKPHHRATLAKGDGSAPKPGKDAVTASSDGGAIMDAKPDYLSNPPPIYPDASRQEKQEGLVVLEVIVNAEGRPESVSVRTSSGYHPLDESAVTAVRGWRFRPATMGSIKVRSRVVIPIRFRLDE